MKGYLINPFDQTIKPVTLEKENTLQQIYTLCGCQLIDAVYSIDDHTVFVDDEGLFVENQRYFKLHDQPLAGKALVLGVNEEGDSTDVKEWVHHHLNNLVDWVAEGITYKPSMSFTAWE